MEMFPGDGGQTIADISTLATMMSREQQAGQVARQRMIDGLVADGKYLWPGISG